jgi:hypothetical protein
MPLLTRNDFEGIGDIANHCDLNKLNIAINEAADFDMEDLFCDFWQDIIENWSSDDDKWVNLISGGEYDGCNGTRTHKGIKRIWAYYAYSRYIILNGFNDTPSGMVQKTNSFSMPTPLKELQAYSDKYRNMAKQSYEKTLSYLCKKATDFDNFNTYDCKGCGCGGNCGERKSNTKGFGISSSIVEKRL